MGKRKRFVAAVAILMVAALFVCCGCEYFMVRLYPPVAVISIQKLRFQPGEAVSVSAWGSNSPHGYTLKQFIWDFGDGSPQVVSNSADAVSHSYSAGGGYSISLEVVDSSGMSGSSSKEVSVNIRPVMAVWPQELTSPPAGEDIYIIQRGREPKKVSGQGIVPVPEPYLYYRLDASNTHDIDGYIVAWKWTWADHELGNEPILYVRIRVGSVYTIRLEATDNEGLKGTIPVDIGYL